MSTRARMAKPAKRAPSKSGRDRKLNGTREIEAKMDMLSPGGRLMKLQNAAESQRNRRDRKNALKQDVDKLKQKLRHEESIHRALERAFSRPLGALPRLPPYLPSQTIELLAEVAVLEEEVICLEEQVVNFRQELYQEAIYLSSSKRAIEIGKDIINEVHNSEQNKSFSQSGSSETSESSCNDQYIPLLSSSCLDHNGISCSPPPIMKRLPRKSNLSYDDLCRKETLLMNNLIKGTSQSPQKMASKISKHFDAKINCKPTHLQKDEDVGSSPNKISEDLLKCLSNIFSKQSINEDDVVEIVPSISGFHENVENLQCHDPYGTFSFFGRRDIGPYKKLRSIYHGTINQNLIVDSSTPLFKLRILLSKLESVDLQGLDHQEKLAFWINIYNSCLLNTFLEHGIPDTPQLVVSFMQKATINVGGHLLSAMTIEHFILRLPFNSKDAFLKGSKNDEMIIRSNFGLDWPEPLVTFALSCGSWSSPAVRVYTASQVESELELAKRDYLQASVGISPKNKLVIPKLLDWYLLDFAKDMESLLDWICLQLPSELRSDVVKCIERGRREAFPSHNVQLLPYEFSFRYLLDT